MTRRKLLQLTGLVLVSAPFRTIAKHKDKKMEQTTEVLIVGGGPAGLSAALTLGRGRRSVIICDHGQPRNAPATHMNNFPSHDGLPPSEFRNLIKRDLKKYKSVQLIQDEILSVEKNSQGFVAKLKSGGIISAKKVLLAHGVKDEMLPIPGLKELWGKSIFHCPYCHGFEHADAAFGLWMNGDMAFHMIPILLGLTSNLTIFTDGPHTFTDEQLTQIQNLGLTIKTSKIKEFIHEGEKLLGVKLEDGEVVRREYLFARLPLKMRSDVGIKLGCVINEQGFYQVDQMNRTTVPGVYSAGDSMDMRHSVLFATASGQFSGAAINHELLKEIFLGGH